MVAVDVDELTVKVQDVYRHVAEEPDGAYHFELGRGLADRLGYDRDVMERVPAEAVESFAGVGHFFDLAGLADGEHVLDLGSGSGTDAFVAAQLVGPSGRVLGVDFTSEQLAKAQRIARAAGLTHLEFRMGRIESLAVDDESFDCVISNGVINLSPDKGAVFREAARALRPGGRLAVADIVSERPLTEAITCNADLWASCIGGAVQIDAYRASIAEAGLRVTVVRDHPEYRFLSGSARGAADTYGVRSISLLAVKPSWAQTRARADPASGRLQAAPPVDGSVRAAVRDPGGDRRASAPSVARRRSPDCARGVGPHRRCGDRGCAGSRFDRDRGGVGGSLSLWWLADRRCSVRSSGVSPCHGSSSRRR